MNVLLFLLNGTPDNYFDHFASFITIRSKKRLKQHKKAVV